MSKVDLYFLQTLITSSILTVLFTDWHFSGRSFVCNFMLLLLGTAE